MPKIVVKYVATFWKLTGKRKEEEEITEGFTIADLINMLLRRYGPEFEHAILDETGELKTNVFLLLNGELIRTLEDSRRILKDGDAVMFSPPIGGG